MIIAVPAGIDRQRLLSNNGCPSLAERLKLEIAGVVAEMHLMCRGLPWYKQRECGEGIGGDKGNLLSKHASVTSRSNEHRSCPRTSLDEPARPVLVGGQGH